ncbi:hypothetical protein [Hoeflea sp.]|uniref:hypothetical protein n=1 Tax=Hoeflea sp. TaxID=1940281 RepID=UPI0019AC0343|nr:hypothetical protein [Hoeflea sp.]MBC7282649.1 hypothetical protein [Hoeflea sp.]
MSERDLFGGRARQADGLKEPAELDCEVIALTDLAARPRFVADDGGLHEAWVPLRHVRFRGNGSGRKGAQVLDIERFKAREIGAL